MNPIPPESNSVCALATDDEERSRDGFASHGQIHIKNALCFQRLTIEDAQRDIGLDQILGRMP
jgi:hypothetical protein